MSKKRVHIIYSGIVQGVGFRWAAERAAISVNVTGWVNNLPDGSVEVMAEGQDENIVLMIDKIKKIMGHNIQATNVTWMDFTGEFKSFNIRFY